ncbi:MAG TPA: phage holin family protein [Pyrinomonadaceae bacterium]|jgi:uncharacterized membrane protein YqjE|nr:phage holin family protein [Pyrinomonadaceae bacterium]
MTERQKLAEVRASAPADLPSLVQRLAEDVANLFDQKLALLKIEIKEDIDAYLRGLVLILAGAIIAAVGFVLTNIALAFAISALFTNANISQPARYGIGFVITGVAYLALGAITILVTKNRLAKVGIVPNETVKELERDKELLKQL